MCHCFIDSDSRISARLNYEHLGKKGLYTTQDEKRVARSKQIIKKKGNEHYVET